MVLLQLSHHGKQLCFPILNSTHDSYLGNVKLTGDTGYVQISVISVNIILMKNGYVQIIYLSFVEFGRWVYRDKMYKYVRRSRL